MHSEFVRLKRRCGISAVRLALFLVAACSISAQTIRAVPDVGASTPQSWADAAAASEERIIEDDGSFPLRYRIRKVDSKSDTTRDVIESRQGAVARLVQRNGRPVTATEDAAERERLNAMLDSPSDFARHHKRDNAARSYAIELVRQMPRAMIFSFAPGQPQRSNFASPQVVIDCTPNPSYRPPTLIDQALTGIQGRIWIDRKTMRVLRVEGRVLHAVDFGWGMLARVYTGCTIEFEQANAGGDRWAYSHLREDITVREMMVKTVQQRAQMDAADFQILPAPVNYQEAIRILLATPVPLR